MSALSAHSLTDEDLGSAAQRERRTRILDAAIALASTGGFEQVQMRAVAEQADVALGTLYRYFPSKIHLLVSALAGSSSRPATSSTRRPIPGDTPADRVMLRARPDHPGPAARAPPHRGADPGLHVRRRVGGRREPGRGRRTSPGC